MKISTASKKVLASALSAAMVIAFAPTVAFAGVAGDPSTEKWTEADYIAAGAIAKKTWIDTEIHAEYYFSVDQLDEALGQQYKFTEVSAATKATLNSVAANTYYTSNAQNATAVNAGTDLTGAEHVYTRSAGNVSGTIKLLKDVTTTTGNKTLEVYAGDAGDSADLTLDLNGFTLAGYTADGKGAADLINVAAGDLTVKNGTLDAANNGANVYEAVVGAVTVDGVTADEFDGAVTVKGTSTLGKIATGGVIVKKGANLTVSTTSTGAATAIDGGLTVEKNGVVTATAVSSGATAIAISGAVDADEEGVVINATAKATGDTGDAYAIKDATATAAAAVTTLNASADSNGGNAYGVFASGATSGVATVKAGSVSANGKNATSSFAVKANTVAISGGTFEGALDIAGGTGITGGSFSVNPSTWVDEDDFDVAKADGLYTVTQFKGFDNGITTYASTGVTADLDTYLKNALTELSKGNSVEGLTLAEGVTAADIVAQAKKGTAGNGDRVTIGLTVKQYVEKNATDAQKAAKAAIDEAAKADLAKVTDVDHFYTVSCQIYYTKKGAVDKTILATVSTLGKKVSGLHAVDNTVKFNFFTASAYDCTNLTAWGYTNGAASKIAFTDTDNDGKANPEADTIEFGTMPTVIALSATDEEALKNAVINGEQPAPAPEKATQGIDVSKKSRTVKIGSKTKTAKALYFKMGASAETELATAKKSGSSRITVSGDKVTLKKGTKKGTYTAKVSLKAAGSDEYLAAAKTITVKFVVKK